MKGVAMFAMPSSRRAFATALGAGLVALARPFRASAQEALPAATGPIGLDSNENPYGPSRRALEAMSRAQASSSRYPDAGEQRLAQALAKLHGVTPAQIALGCGSGEILKMADAAFLGPGKTVIAAAPTFEAVLDYARATRAKASTVPLTSDHRHDLPSMARACDARTGLVYLCNPNNPTGTIVSVAEMTRFLGQVPKTAVVLVDEAYHHFVEDPAYDSALSALPAHDNLIVVRTFSKIYGLAGMRLGYAVASLARAAALRDHQIWSNANNGVIEAALASLDDPDHVERQRAILNGTKRWLTAELGRDGRRIIPSHANFVMFDVGRDVGPLIDAFRERGLRVGRRFPALPTWMRVSIGTDPEMRAFVLALREIAPAASPAA